MGRLLKWNKFGDVEVFEGDHGLAVGNKETGYDVFASKGDVEIHRDGKVTYLSVSGTMGTYDTKKKASDLVREIDEAMSREGDVTTIKVIGGKPIEAFSQSSTKEGGAMIAYQEGDIVGKVHEGAHFECGHLGKGLKGPTTLKEEKQAVKKEVEKLKEMGIYKYPQIRYAVMSHLSTYHKKGSPFKKLARAEEFVYSVE